MARTSVVMITDGAALDFTGSPVKADGYYGFSDGMHTVSFHLNDFRGRIYIEATLVDTEQILHQLTGFLFSYKLTKIIYNILLMQKIYLVVALMVIPLSKHLPSLAILFTYEQG